MGKQLQDSVRADGLATHRVLDYIVSFRPIALPILSAPCYVVYDGGLLKHAAGGGKTGCVEHIRQ